MLRRLVSACAVVLVVGLAACGGGSDSAPASGSDDSVPAAEDGLTVFAAASLTEVFEALDPDVTYSFAGSDELATQIREGAPTDLYAAASPRYPQELFGEGIVEEPVAFATNRLVVIVPRGNPAGISTVQDVAGEGVKLVIADEGVPVGDYTRAVLATLGLEAALTNVVSNEADVKGVVGKVALGEADAGFVYATDATTAAEDVEAIEIPANAQPPVEYQIAVVAGTERREAAEAFLELLLGEQGQAALTAAGFGVP
jgi:molybdate transport system substrate-binding protein